MSLLQMNKIRETDSHQVTTFALEQQITAEAESKNLQSMYKFQSQFKTDWNT